MLKGRAMVQRMRGLAVVIGLHPRPWIALAGLVLIGAGLAWWIHPAAGLVSAGVAMFGPAQAEAWSERRGRGRGRK